ncbi:histidinol dehydrogenase [Ammonifex degensii KC4]|uniref:Histidinol dehydrogenase n=1 Tax=Ammonifex degensii (strain DSM 10501 / KC4) TaxID=429009 RepID=C9RB49_AMMDK|nr:histidinol dehydrogenase [Ammonifex degensii]ACX51476.1 histidinol dehydrogenase [Ammonifex degensii KC4]
MLKIITYDDPRLPQVLDRRFSFPSEAADQVASILQEVKEKGDEAVLSFTARFDRVNLRPEELEVTAAEIDRAYEEVSPAYLTAVKCAVTRIFNFHAKHVPKSWHEVKPDGSVWGELVRPLERVGIYVPGGRARYPSSVLMNAVPARVAGVKEIVMATPPGPEGRVDPHVLVAAREAGVSRIFRVGGAQAVAALAYGTERIPRVDKIVGPGNIYVTLAKRMVFGQVGIDLLAGPSEVAVVADETAPAAWVAADLLAQAEHDPQARVLLVTTSRELAEEVNRRLQEEWRSLGSPSGAREALLASWAVLVPDLSAALDCVNRFAPEHLELLVADPAPLVEQVKHAGAIFLGPYSPVPMGDYIAGPNHVLPTGGTARFASPLGVADFLKRTSVLKLSPAAFQELAPHAAALAEVEGLVAHARAIKVRGV